MGVNHEGDQILISSLSSLRDIGFHDIHGQLQIRPMEEALVDNTQTAYPDLPDAPAPAPAPAAG